MRKQTVTILLIASFVTGLLSCASSRNAEPSRIGIMPLAEYKVAATQLTADTAYRVLRSNEDFNATFAPSISNARRPDFNSQIVVALLLKEANTGLQFSKAEIVEKTVNIYVESCTSSTDEGCMKGSVVMATIPKAGNVNKVAFYINGSSRFISGL